MEAPRGVRPQSRLSALIDKPLGLAPSRTPPFGGIFMRTFDSLEGSLGTSQQPENAAGIAWH